MAAVHRPSAVAPLLVVLLEPVELLDPVLDELLLEEVDEPLPGEDVVVDEGAEDAELLLVLLEVLAPAAFVFEVFVPPPLPLHAARASPVVTASASLATCRRATRLLLPMVRLLRSSTHCWDVRGGRRVAPLASIPRRTPYP